MSNGVPPPPPKAPAATMPSMQTDGLHLDVNDPWVKVQLARRRLARHLTPTILKNGRHIEGYEDFELYYKCDHLRRTGSFKERGALNSLLALNAEERKKGVIAASAGNHSQALSYWGGKLRIPVTVVMPETAPMNKIENCKHYKANVVVHGKNFQLAKEKAEELCKQHGYRYINGYNDIEIIAGAGTCGLEILDELPDVDAIVVPVGGGGLIAGIALAVKRLYPNVQIIGVETDQCPSMTAALAAGKPVPTPVGHTIADGLAVPVVGPDAFRIVQRFVDKVLVVKESYVSMAVLHLLEKEKLLVEGAGCCGLAAMFAGQLDFLKGKKIATVLCGGNIDIAVLGRVVERGLHSNGRLFQFDCAISDRVGGLARFVHHLAQTKASVKEIVQEHPFISDVHICSVHCTIETLNFEHKNQIVKYMLDHGFVLKDSGTDDKYADVNKSKL